MSPDWRKISSFPTMISASRSSTRSSSPSFFTSKWCSYECMRTPKDSVSVQWGFTSCSLWLKPSTGTNSGSLTGILTRHLFKDSGWVETRSDWWRSSTISLALCTSESTWTKTVKMNKTIKINMRTMVKLSDGRSNTISSDSQRVWSTKLACHTSSLQTLNTSSTSIIEASFSWSVKPRIKTRTSKSPETS